MPITVYKPELQTQKVKALSCHKSGLIWGHMVQNYPKNTDSI